MPRTAATIRSVRLRFVTPFVSPTIDQLTISGNICPLIAWGRDDDLEEQAGTEDDKSNELLWAILASYLPSGTYRALYSRTGKKTT
jgi:hypothetical protein